MTGASTTLCNPKFPVLWHFGIKTAMGCVESNSMAIMLDHRSTAVFIGRRYKGLLYVHLTHSYPFYCSECKDGG